MEGKKCVGEGRAVLKKNLTYITLRAKATLFSQILWLVSLLRS